MAIKGMQRHKTVQEILLESKALSEDQLRQAEADAAANNRPLQQAVVELKLLGKEQLLKDLSAGWQVEMADIAGMEIGADIVKLIPEKLARRHVAVPFAKSENVVAFAMGNPGDLDVLDDLRLRTGLEIKPYLALPQDIFATLDAAHGKGGGALIRSLAREEEKVVEVGEWVMPKGSGLELVKPESKSDIAKVDASAPEVEKLVNAIILSALALKASDIHIVPRQDPAGKQSLIVLRFRVDGILVPAPFKVPWAYRSALIAKLKIMTDTMNITERRLPQSGRIQVLNKGNPIEFRVEILPTVHGEACVMRILDRNSVLVDIRRMGFLPDTLDGFLDLLKGIGGKKNFGLVLVCGPTGSGKSTTLYAALNHINRPDINILTAENPVEYNLDGIVQIPVNPELKLGNDKRFDFAAAMRSFLRFDPDVIMIGEIRDRETAHIALEAAMTGHLVFSTIHTNDAPSAISRLTDMGVPDFLVVGTVKAVLAQRLSRRLCPECRKPHGPTPEEIGVFRENSLELPSGAKLYGPGGCAACKGAGFKGRLGLHELLVMTDGLRALFMGSAALDVVRAAARKLGMRTIVQDGLLKSLEGLTTVREVIGGREEG
jgi:type II secretory ATPase GspE/PulE/Tfp pilus assembly ATPase PilB-like protein